MFAAAGPMMFFLLPLAGQGNDLVSLIDAADYFKSRQVEVKVEQMVKLAGAKPEGSADSIAQLLAIRWLGEHAEEVKKAKARDLLQQLADGKLPGDAQGFAKDYAQKALARLDGKPVPLPTIPDKSIATEALAWFPDTVNFVFAADVRNTIKEAKVEDNAALALLRTKMAAREKEFIWNFADTVGNVRVDRISFGFKMRTDGGRGDPEDIYLRFTGLGDRVKLAKYLFVQGNAKATSEEKGPAGEKITFLEFGGREPGVAIVGDTDVIVAGKERPNNENNMGHVREMLEVRAGKKAGVAKGPLAAGLKDVPGNASTVMAGRLAPELFRPFGGDLNLPEDMVASVVVGKTIELRLVGKMAKGEEGKTFVEAVAKWKEQGLAGLKDPALPFKAETKAVFQKALESIKVDADGAAVKGAAQITGDLQSVLQEVFGQLLKSTEREPVPPPPLPEPVK